MKLELRLDRDRVAPGEELTGDVVVVEGGESRALTLTVGFHERSPSFHEVPFGATGVLHEGELATGATIPFRYELPAWAAPGVEGRYGELFWEVEAASDDPGLDTRARARFDVVI